MPRTANLHDMDDDSPPPAALFEGEAVILRQPMQASDNDEHGWRRGGEEPSAAAVAQAFLRNASGGAACYSVDLSMVVTAAITEELTDALGALYRNSASLA